jgi:tetratricopeptide (TPR) repeat protein
MDEDIYILIDRYLTGELNMEEQKGFEEKIRADADFAEKVLLYRSLTENMRSRFTGEEEEKRLQETLSAISKAEIPVERSAKVVSLRWYHWAAAASVALLAVFWFYTGTSTLPEYSQYASHETLALTERGSDSLQHHAEEAFNSKNYAQALTYFDKLLKTEPANTELQLFKGIALLELDRFQEAGSIFSTIKNSDTVYRDKATWYLALTALKQKDYDRCKALLEQIPAGSEDHDRAREILKGLD